MSGSACHVLFWAHDDAIRDSIPQWYQSGLWYAQCSFRNSRKRINRQKVSALATGSLPSVCIENTCPEVKLRCRQATVISVSHIAFGHHRLTSRLSLCLRQLIWGFDARHTPLNMLGRTSSYLSNYGTHSQSMFSWYCRLCIGWCLSHNALGQNCDSLYIISSKQSLSLFQWIPPTLHL